MYRNFRPVCLTATTHERYQSNMNDIDVDFLLLDNEKFVKWNRQYAELPKNHAFIRPTKIVPELNYNCVLSQNKFGQFQLFQKVANVLGIPFISIEHTLPSPDYNPQKFIEMSNMVSDINLFISEYNKEQWGNPPNSYIIEHCIDSNEFCDLQKERTIDVISVVNDYINRDYFCGYKIWQHIIDTAQPKYSVFGSTPGLSEPAKNIDHLITEYNKAKIYLNTSLVSPIPTALLEGMACGCVPISTANCMIPDIIVNGVNGFMSNNFDELIDYIDIVKNDEDLRQELSKNARETIVKRFNKDRFTKSWNAVFAAI